METIIQFFRDNLIMNWLQGERVLVLFEDYLLSQPDAYIVLVLYGVGILAVLGALRVVKEILKMTLLWVKIVLFIALIYYLFVVVLGIDIWGFVFN
jgi:hypothetical protein